MRLELVGGGGEHFSKKEFPYRKNFYAQFSVNFSDGIPDRRWNYGNC